VARLLTNDMYLFQRTLFSILRDFSQAGSLWSRIGINGSTAFATFALSIQAMHDGRNEEFDRMDVRADSRQCNANVKHGKRPENQTNEDNSTLKPFYIRPSVPSRRCGERLRPVCGEIFVTGILASPHLAMRLQSVEMQRQNVLPHVLMLWAFEVGAQMFGQRLEDWRQKALFYIHNAHACGPT
jgi:hypothetical protein